MATRREWLGLIVLALPCLVLAMDLTILHLAVPTLSAALHPSPAQLLWIVDVYGFLLAGSLITMGTIGDRIGRRRLLLIGAGAFAAASLLSAVAPTPAALIAARALLGVAAATLTPSTLSLIRTMFQDERERTTAIAIWGTGFAAGGALGPLVGGLLLSRFWWGSVFLVPLPVMALVLLAGPRLLPEHRDPHPGPLDLASVALSLGAVLATIYGLKLIAQDGPGSAPALAVATGAVLGGTFLHRQRRLDHPLLDLALFVRLDFGATLAILTLNAFVMFASSFLSAQYLQVVLGLSPLHAGLCTLPASVGVVASSLLSPRLVGRAPRSSVLATCLLLCAAGFATLALVGLGGLPVVILGAVVIGLGAGPVGTLASDAIIGAAPVARAGAAAAITSTSPELGGALGIALLGSASVAISRLAVAGGAAPQAAFSQGFVVVALVSAALMVVSAGLMHAVAARVRAQSEPQPAITPSLAASTLATR